MPVERLKNLVGPFLTSSKRVRTTTFDSQTISKQPGSYILILTNTRDQTLSVGRLGEILFPPGVYTYAGSAMGGLSKRVGRYFREIRKPFWHIDTLIPVFLVTSLWLFPSSIRQECQIARLLSQAPGATPILGFGSTDCRCPSHLFHFANLKEIPLFLEIKKILNCRHAVKISNL